MGSKVAAMRACGKGKERSSRRRESVRGFRRPFKCPQKASLEPQRRKKKFPRFMLWGKEVWLTVGELSVGPALENEKRGEKAVRPATSARK